MLDEDTRQQEKAAPSPELIARRQAARKVGRIVIEHGYRMQNPQAGADEVKQAVAAAKPELGKTGKRVLKALEKAGLSIVPGEPAPRRGKKQN